jgi:GTP pyrophosphokinase
MSSERQPAAASHALPMADEATRARFAPIAAGLAEGEQSTLARALATARLAYGDKLLGTGEPVLGHGLGMAGNIAALRLDLDARVAALLYALPEYAPGAAATMAEEFSPVAARLVEGISRLDRLRLVARVPAQAEVLRKMLLAMVEDIRVVLLRLASRTQTLRHLTRSPDALRIPFARETLDLYAPLANRLGVWRMKWELEDLSFRFLEPQLYKRIARMLDEKRDEREGYIAGAIAALERELAAAGIRPEITGRPKHIYSIYTKMRAKSLEFDQLYDVRALRVLVPDVKDCYTALGVVHNLWQPIPREFDDYISRPKGNFYRSLHTAVIGPEGRSLEVQIRTADMHREAELGVAAHWRYKEGARGGPDPYDEKIAWLRQALAWRDEVAAGTHSEQEGDADWLAQFKQASLDDTVYVITPQGKVVELPAGSTAVDFAYALHTDLGHRCRGAKVDGAMVPLDTPLASGQRVEIIAAKAGGPSRDWLNPGRGYLHSHRARTKVRQWFNNADLALTIDKGRSLVERELHRERRSDLKLEDLARALGQGSPEDLFAAVGREEVGLRALQAAIRPAAEPEPDAGLPAAPARERRGQEGGILIVGVDRLLTQLARCCKPVPPDPIRGFVTRGRGISVHRADCASLVQLERRAPERLIEAQWGERPGEQSFAADIAVQATDRPQLLRELSDALSRAGIAVSAVASQARRGQANYTLTVEVKGVAGLRQALALAADVPGVASVRRR